MCVCVDTRIVVGRTYAPANENERTLVRNGERNEQKRIECVVFILPHRPILVRLHEKCVRVECK